MKKNHLYILDTADSYEAPILHENILDILFKHKEEIYIKLLDLQGTLFLDHIAVNIIDPCNRLVIFSTTPSVEYNLIVENIWLYDSSFLRHHECSNQVRTWESSYRKSHFHEIKTIKETKHGFTLGISITKNIDDFQLVYSFATRQSQVFNYYCAHQQALMNIGDYTYRLLHPIYSNYCKIPVRAPLIQKTKSMTPQLKLVINNR